MKTYRCPDCDYSEIDPDLYVMHRERQHGVDQGRELRAAGLVSDAPPRRLDLEGSELDDVTEKEILLEIFREARATKRILLWVLVIIPIAWAVLVFISLVLAE